MNDAAFAYLKEVARVYNDVVLDASIDSHIAKGDHAGLVEMLMETIELMAMSHKMTRETFADHIARTPPAGYFSNQPWQDMNS